MGLFDFIKGQLIEVIEWTDDTQDTMVYRFPVEDKEIKMGAQLTVRESQVAVFVNEGKIADIFAPGRYKLSTSNLPVLTTIFSWKYGFESPFKAEVYFVNTRQFTDQKWGTSNPIMMRDQEFGMLRLRAYGIYAFKVKDATIFLREIFGTNSQFSTKAITGQIKRMIISGVSDLIAESRIPALDLAMYYDELSDKAKEKIATRLEEIGLSIASFFIENISLPEEVEKMLDKRTSMGVIGNMQTYAQFNTAEAIKDAANNPSGGIASMGAGIGAGVQIGNAMAGAFNNQQNTNSNEATETCPKCQASIKANSKFCPECGAKIAMAKVPCVSCKELINEGMKFCPHCGASQSEVVCPKCNAKLSPGTKFCNECGNKID